MSSIGSTRDGRWAAAVTGLKVLCWSSFDGATRYGEITGYDPAKQSFYVVMDDDPSGEPEYIHWAHVRPA